MPAPAIAAAAIGGLASLGGSYLQNKAQEKMAEQAAAQRAWTLLSKPEITASRLVSYVNERRCSLCELCIDACPYQARIKDEENRKIVVREALCQGCGACAMACANSAAKMKGGREDQVLSMVDTLLLTG